MSSKKFDAVNSKEVKAEAHEKYVFIIRLYNALKKIYPEANQKKPLIAQSIVKETLEPMYLDPLYEKLYRQYYVFYSLFSQNTMDVYTRKTVRKLFEAQKKANFAYEMDFYRDYFYKHKDRNAKALPQILSVLKQITEGTKTVEALHKVKGLGFKSSALIYNEFVSENRYPVIDVHVIKSYNFFSETLKKFSPVSAQFLYRFLADMDRDLDIDISYDFCSRLYYHRKFVCDCKCDCKMVSESCSWCKGVQNFFQKEKDLVSKD